MTVSKIFTVQNRRLGPKSVLNHLYGIESFRRQVTQLVKSFTAFFWKPKVHYRVQSTENN